MTKSLFPRTIGIILVLALITEVAVGAENERNEGRRRGALGGALVGLTMGALTGDAGLAAAGAVAGGVTGGVAGSWRDYEEDRKDYRAETLAGAIAEKDDGGDGEAPAQWSEIDSFVDSWLVQMWGLDAEGTRIDASAAAQSSLNTTRSVTFRFIDFKTDSGDYSEADFGSSTLGFEADRGFELVNDFVSSLEGNRYVGHFDNPSNRYKFYYAGTDQETFSGIKRTDYRLEMQLIGGDVILIDTWAMVGSEEKRIHSYRLTRM
jgi:hypothetical protein